MQTACPELYEKEKAENKGVSIGELYSKKYELEYERNRLNYFNYTDLVFDHSDNFIICLHYSSFGIFNYNFYIVQNNGEYYLRYFNLKDVHEKAYTLGKNFIDNIACCDATKVGIQTTEYKKFIKKLASPKIPINKAELMNILNNIKGADIGDDYLETLTHKYAFTNLEMLNFFHKKYFATDDYVLPKYKGSIELINFIFANSEIPKLGKCHLRYINSIKEAKEKLIDLHLRRKYHIHIDYNELF